MNQHPLIVANWKMHKTLSEAVAFIQTAGEALSRVEGAEVVICPPFVSLSLVEGLLRNTRVALGAQNVAAEAEGAFTGEVSASMLAGHCKYVIVGHSERRRLFGESIEVVDRKLQRCIEAELQPVVCISSVLEVEGLQKLKSRLSEWIVAYEPLEAIGSGHPADPTTVAPMMELIKKTLGKSTRVLYGGSVTDKDIAQYVPLTDGALVGGASLDPQGFLALCQKAAKAGKKA